MKLGIYRLVLSILMTSLLGMFVCPPARAFSLFPVRLYIDESHKVAALSVSNPTDRDITVQPRAFKWTQESSASGALVDKLTDSTEFTIFPPVVTLKPQAKQTIRIRYNGSMAGAEEEAFRVITEELLVKPIPGIVNFANAISIPIFVRAKVDLNPDLIWRVKRVEKDILQLDFDNSVGNRHIQITGFSATKKSDDGVTNFPITQTLFQYVLPKSQGNVRINNASLPSGTYQIKLTTDYKELDQTVELK